MLRLAAGISWVGLARFVVAMVLCFLCPASHHNQPSPLKPQLRLYHADLVLG